MERADGKSNVWLYDCDSVIGLKSGITDIILTVHHILFYLSLSYLEFVYWVKYIKFIKVGRVRAYIINLKTYMYTLNKMW